MAELQLAYERMILNEGGYRLTSVQDDRGGQTYAGIARNAWPQWDGWEWIDRGETPPASKVREFYRANFWDAIQGDMIASQHITQIIFDFAVNAGVRVAAILAQTVAGVTPDGQIGQKTIEALNKIEPDKFAMAYTLAKIARYAQIVTRDRSQQKFLLGWINRALRELAS